tara:strand:+ start:198 stop:1166 length:969 start_codon:yes stop_codon:yes gene_type:complete
MFYFILLNILLRLLLKDKNEFFFHPLPRIMISKLYLLCVTKKISNKKKIHLFSKFFCCFLFSIFSIFLLNIDDLFFNYRDIYITNPLFIIGKFRSATTFAHRELLKSNKNYISPTLKDCLFPFICLQYVFDFLNIFINFDKILNYFLGQDILDKHQMAFNLEEEDDLFISTYFGISWYNILQFPFFETWICNGHIKTLSNHERYHIYSFYHKFYQKILYKRGDKNSILLCKSHMIDMTNFYYSFPNATIISVQRDQNKVHQSTLSLFKLVHRKLHNIFYDECIYNKNLKLFYQYFDNNKLDFKDNTIYIDYEKNVDITKIFL